MEKPQTLLKQYLRERSDEELKRIYSKELVRENDWKEIDLDMFIWISANQERADWALLNEIADRWTL